MVRFVFCPFIYVVALEVAGRQGMNRILKGNVKSPNYGHNFDHLRHLLRNTYNADAFIKHIFTCMNRNGIIKMLAGVL